METPSCNIPQKIKVITNDNEAGKTTLRGLNIYLPNVLYQIPYSYMGFWEMWDLVKMLCYDIKHCPIFLIDPIYKMYKVFVVEII